jgi:hypothetical protein
MRQIASLGSVLLLVVCSMTWSAEPNEEGAKPRAENDRSGSNRFESLFNGRDFEGWQQAGNWRIVEGALYCPKMGDVFDRRKEANRYVAKPIPADCEIVFQWREDSIEREKYNPAFEISYDSMAAAMAAVCNAASGTGFSYHFSGVSIELHTGSLGESLPPGRIQSSGMGYYPPLRDYSKPAGQWNEGRILCKGARIQFWLNDIKVYDLDLEIQKNTNETKGYNSQDWAIDDWIRLKKAGLYLNIIPTCDQQEMAHRVQIRSVAMRPLAATEQLDNGPGAGAGREAAAAGDAAGTRWNWQADPLFGKLPISLDVFPKGSVSIAPPPRFSSLDQPPNLSASRDPAIIHATLLLSNGTIQDSDVKAVFLARYQEKDSIGIAAWQTVSPEKANTLYAQLRRMAEKSNQNRQFWIVGEYVISLTAGKGTSRECYATFEKHIENAARAVAKMR